MITLKIYQGESMKLNLKSLTFIIMLQLLFSSFSFAGTNPDRQIRREKRQAKRAVRQAVRRERRETRREDRFQNKKERVLEKQDERSVIFFNHYDKDYKKVVKKIEKALRKYEGKDLVNYTNLYAEQIFNKGRIEEARTLAQYASEPETLRVNLDYFTSNASMEDHKIAIQKSMESVSGFYNYMFLTKRKKRIGCFVGNIAMQIAGGLTVAAGAVGLGVTGIIIPLSALFSGGGALVLLAPASLGASIGGGIGVTAVYERVMVQQSRCEWDYREFTL
jgi:5S rRNA maturation endonuclease (ribonuclease M5)